MKVSIQQPATETVKREFNESRLRFFFTTSPYGPGPFVPEQHKRDSRPVIRAAFDEVEQALEYAKCHCTVPSVLFGPPVPIGPGVALIDTYTGKEKSGRDAVRYLKKVKRGED